MARKPRAIPALGRIERLVMIVLHAGSCEGQILLWAEMSPEKSARPTGPRSRSAKPQPAHRYGCDGGRVGLARALEACATIRPKAARFREVMIWLPTSNQGNGQAISSSPLIAEAPASSDTPALAPWIIEALALSNGEAVELLCACMGKRTLAAGIVVGDDLAYWADALRFAGATVARQQYLPHLAMENKRCRAQWEPHLAGKDTERFARLANQMPPVARALSDVGGVAPPDTSASIILRQFVALAVDHLVRSSCAGESAGGVGQRTVGSGRKKKIGFASAHDAWLCALRSGDGIVEGAADSVAHLSEQVAQWQRPIAVAAASPFRLCFRLEEPPKEPASELSQERPEPWRVRYLLQAHDDPSLIVPVAAAWETRNRTAAALMSFGSNA
ncbi:hypothetical protein FJY63_00690, partial [Candidatus Sumerlaeota bacterium]|nr:hypothetical protein [Candidatus Sumerlaeota bacterium]